MILTLRKKTDLMALAYPIYRNNLEYIRHHTGLNLEQHPDGTYVVHSCCEALQAFEGGYLVYEQHRTCPPDALDPHRGGHPVKPEVFPLLYRKVYGNLYQQLPVQVKAVEYDGTNQQELFELAAQSTIHRVFVAKNRVYNTSYESPQGYPITPGKVLILGVMGELYTVNNWEAIATKYHVLL